MRKGETHDSHSAWHYYDTPIRFTSTQPTVQPSNAAVALTESVTRLTQLHKGTYNGPTFPGITKDDLQVWWLGWILHLTGDLHQPLHCVSNYGVPGHVGQSDNGGNGFKLAGGGALHTWWDAALADTVADEGFHISNVDTASNPSATLSPVTASLKNTAVKIGKCTELNVTKWIGKEAKLADTTAYDGLNPGDQPSAPYIKSAHSLCRQEGVLAGCRLANVLKGVFS